MKSRLQKRLETLEAEHKAGQKMLAELDARRQGLTTTMLRIEGAMQVLREMLDEEAGATPSEHPERMRVAG